MYCARYITVAGALLAGLAVAAGAFGAHGLQQHFGDKYRETETKIIAGVSVPASQKYYDDYRTAVTYHMWHALGMIAAGLLMGLQPRRSLNVAAWCFGAGIVLFSGSLYLLTIAGPRWLGVPWGMITPIGGMLFLVGWAALAIGACPCGASRASVERSTLGSENRI